MEKGPWSQEGGGVEVGIGDLTLGLPGCLAPPLSCHVLSWVDLAQLLE